MYEIEPGIIGFFVLVTGLLFGSMVTLVSYRLPRGQDVIFERSQCQKCHHALGVLDLLPVFSWLLRGGKCSHCGVRVSIRYPLIEVTQALLFYIVYSIMGITPHSVVVMLLSSCLMIMIVTDIEFTIIPDQIQYVMAVLGVAYQLLPGGNMLQLFIGPVIGILFGYFLRYFFWLWKRKEALGWGDVKFLGVVGLFLPGQAIITFLFLTGMLGIVTSLMWTAVGKGKQFPFGPALALALLFCVLKPDAQEGLREYILNLAF